jgi:DNA-binding transcriptional LysR family regulator
MNNAQMELRDLEYFLACVEAGSITRAARRVHVAQPTLSHALARLESELGVRVLERGARAPLLITEAGQRLAERARQALGALGALQDDLAQVARGTRGQLRLCAVQSACANLLPRALAQFCRTHPGVELSVRTLAAEKVTKAVVSGQADLGFLAGAPGAAPRDVERELVRREELVALVRKRDVLAKHKVVRLAALADRPLVLVPSGTFTGEIIHDACRAAGFAPRVVLTLSSAEALCEVVRAGLAMTILPAGYLRPRSGAAGGQAAGPHAAPGPLARSAPKRGPTHPAGR